MKTIFLPILVHPGDKWELHASIDLTHWKLGFSRRGLHSDWMIWIGPLHAYCLH